ncbi:MAG: DUF6884 domain-containing protein [Limisphaerales bacterium]
MVIYDLRFTIYDGKRNFNATRRAVKKIVLISCVKKKLPHKAKAEHLYISPLFRGYLRYAKNLKPDDIFILSAKYELLELEREIEPYNSTLKEMSVVQVRAWADKVLEQLKQRADLQKDHFVFLAGEKYRKFLMPHLALSEAPLEGMSFGKQLQKFKSQTHEPNLP